MTDGDGAALERPATKRAERDEARRRRAQELARTPTAGGRRRDDPRLPAPWGPFPLTELVVLLAIGLLIGAFVVRGERGRTMLAAGLLLGSLGGHTTIFAAAAGVLPIVVVTLIVHPIKLWIVALLALAMFCITFYRAREAFKRRSGGVGFKAGR